MEVTQIFQVSFSAVAKPIYRPNKAFSFHQCSTCIDLHTSPLAFFGHNWACYRQRLSFSWRCRCKCFLSFRAAPLRRAGGVLLLFPPRVYDQDYCFAEVGSHMFSHIMFAFPTSYTVLSSGFSGWLVQASLQFGLHPLHRFEYTISSKFV